MELDFYLLKSGIKKKDFAQKIGVQGHHLARLVRKEVNPTLITAIRIHEATGGLVTYREMVRLQDRLKPHEKDL